MAKQTPVESSKQEKIASIFSVLESAEIQELLEQRAARAVFALGVELLEQDVESLCGARYARKKTERCYRFGKEQTSIVVGGARYVLERPRIRGNEGEVYPPTLKKLRNQDLLDEEMKEHLLLGVSTRNYERVIEGFSNKTGVSKSSVSRAFKRASQKELDSINQGDLSDSSFVALIVDGVEIGGRVVIAALGITETLEKVPVGLVEGATENSEVVSDLLSSLNERGFTPHCQNLLCVLDGSKALRKAVVSVFGDTVIIQRCWLHKMRNIQSYLPKGYHQKLLWRMKKLMGLRSYEDARREYQSLKAWLENISFDAGRSLDEAGEELLAVHRLGVTGELRKSLTTTNAIESLFSLVRAKLGNVKNWKARKSAQALRWIASAINQHKRDKMRSLRGLNQRHKLIAALGERLDDERVSA